MASKLMGLSVTFTVGALALACSSDVEEKAFYKGGEPAGPVGTNTAAPVDPPFEAADYPVGPYGTNTGSVVANYQFSGWKAPAVAEYAVDNFEAVQMADFYDPDGTKHDGAGIKVIMLNASSVWCTVCRAEYAKFKAEGTYAMYRAKGVEFVGAILQDGANPPKPAKPSDLQYWGNQYSVEFPLILDPGQKLGQFFTADATPMNLLVDARTMVIIGKYLGGDVTKMFAQLDQVLAE